MRNSAEGVVGKRAGEKLRTNRQNESRYERRRCSLVKRSVITEIHLLSNRRQKLREIAVRDNLLERDAKRITISIDHAVPVKANLLSNNRLDSHLNPLSNQFPSFVQ